MIDYPYGYTTSFGKHWPKLSSEELLSMLPVSRRALIEKYGIWNTDEAVKELRKTHEILAVGWDRHHTVTYELKK
jgi:hypothetical protein